MSDVIDQAVKALNEKDTSDFGDTAKFVIDGEGAIMLDGEGARAGDEDATVTMMADADTFQQILDGSVNPTTAFMSGKLKIDGDMGAAMRLAPLLG